MQVFESGVRVREPVEDPAELGSQSLLPFDFVGPSSEIEGERAEAGVELECADPEIEDCLDDEADQVQWRRFLQRYRRWVTQKLEEGAEQGQDKHTLRLQYDLKVMTLERRLELVKKFFQERECEDGLRAVVIRRLEGLLAKRKEKFIDAKSILLTYNGDWGLVNDVELPPVDDIPGSRTEAVNQVCEQLRTHPRVLKMWDEFTEKVTHWKEALFLASVAFSFELCTHTFETERKIRLHAHAFLRHGSKLRVRSGSDLAFQGVQPFRSDQGSGGTVKARGSSGNSGMYYLQVPKIGSVFRSGSIEPFKDYLVPGEWIMNLVQAGKVEYQVARDQLVRSAKNLPRLLQSLDRWHQETQRSLLRDVMGRVHRSLESTRKPFKSIPIVNDWVKSHSEIAMRYKFLVLCGGSGLGKTQFAKNLVPSGKCLELNMACAPEPDMREYDCNEHDLVLFDECSPHQILRQKKLFQCPAVEVALAASVTSCHSYKVWVHQKLFVVATNVWHHEIEELSCDSAAWLEANSVVYDVQEPLWEK